MSDPSSSFVDQAAGRNHSPARVWWMPLLIIAAGVIAYFNSLDVPFIFDDYNSIVDNATIRSLRNLGAIIFPPAQMGVSGRPILNLSLAINYAISGLNPRGYHVVNIAIHIAAALALFGLVRRTCLSPRLRSAMGRRAPLIALAAALIWAVHPLGTMSVTYVIQRAESMVSLAYLLTLYFAARGFASMKPSVWFLLSIVSCALGMGCKEVMVTAPIAVLFYDGVFFSQSIRGALTRKLFYACLLATEVILLGLVASNPRSHSAGFSYKDISALEYLRTQPQVILHYLTLVFWPHPLCLDSDWPIAQGLSQIFPAAAAVVIMLIWAGIAMFRGSAAGFLVVLVFLVLAPTSSFVPINVVASDHRMYLASAAFICLIVGAIYQAMTGRRAASSTDAPSGQPLAAIAAGLLVAAGLTVLTVQRNRVYQSELSIWTDTVRLRPENPRAVNSLGFALTHLGRFEESIPYYRRAIALKPQYVDAHFNLAEDLRRVGKKEEALAEYDAALAIDPRDWQALTGRASILASDRKLDEAAEACERALAIRPEFAPALAGLGLIRASQGKVDEAIGLYRRAIKADPANARMEMEMGIICAVRSDLTGAAQAFGRALQLDPSLTPARYRLAMTLAGLGQHRDAILQYQQIIQPMASLSEFHCRYAQSLESVGQYADAAAELRKALEIEPSRPEAKLELAWILATCPDEKIRRVDEALTLAKSVNEISKDSNFAVLDTLGAAYANAGQFDEAIKTGELALALAQAARQPEAQQKISERIATYRMHEAYRSMKKN